MKNYPPPKPKRPRSAWVGWIKAFGQGQSDAGKSEATVESYCRHVDWLSEAYPEGPWHVTPQQLETWLDDHNWSAHTRRKVLVSLRAFYAWGIHEGECQRSPLAGLSAIPPRRRGPARAELSPLWAEPVETFLAWLRSGARRDSTIEQRRWWLVRLSETYSDPWSVTASELARWISRDDWSPQTKRLARSSVQNFYRWAELDERVAVSPARSLPVVSTPRARPRPAPDDVVAVALERADERVRLAITIASLTGLRRAEIANLHTRDIYDAYLVVVGKGGHERIVPLHPDLRAALSVEMRKRREGEPRTGWGRVEPKAEGWVFPSDDPRRPITAAHLGKLIAAALPGSWTTHPLRHRFATQAYADSRDIRAVQELLGHTKPETTAIYAAVPDGALAAAVHGASLPRPSV